MYQMSFDGLRIGPRSTVGLRAAWVALNETTHPVGTKVV